MPRAAQPILASLNDTDTVHVLALLERHVDRSGGPDACWPWTGGTRVRGYGAVYTSGNAAGRRLVKTHRLAYEAANDGDCPPSIDHLCHDHEVCEGGENCPHRLCCNPAHLAGRSVGANSARAQEGRLSETCSAGHPMTPDNVYEAPDGGRFCRRCRSAGRSARRRAPAPLPLKRRYRPRGMTTDEMVEWALAGQSTDECCYWPVAVGSEGYAEVKVDGRSIGAHVLVYRTKVGSIPRGHVIDHACHDPDECSAGSYCPHRACINPDHLRAVTVATNLAPSRSSRRRPDRCKRKHKFTPENTYVDKRGSRHCKACGARRLKESRAKAREAATLAGPG